MKNIITHSNYKNVILLNNSLRGTITIMTSHDNDNEMKQDMS